MIDRSKLGPKKSKNPVKKLFQKVMGGTRKAAARDVSEAVSSAKVVIGVSHRSENNNNETPSMFDSNGMDSSSHSQKSILKNKSAEQQRSPADDLPPLVSANV